jgi:hypothetical protein
MIVHIQVACGGCRYRKPARLGYGKGIGMPPLRPDQLSGSARRFFRGLIKATGKEAGYLPFQIADITMVGGLWQVCPILRHLGYPLVDGCYPLLMDVDEYPNLLSQRICPV